MLLVWINESEPLESIAQEIQNLPKGTRVICSDLADGLHNRFGDVPVVVILPSILDYTNTTKEVTSRLYKRNSLFFTEELSWRVWNAYDGARAISAMIRENKPLTVASLSNKIDASVQSAALRIRMVR